MNEPLQMARSLATLTLPLDEMQGVGRHFGATLNDLSVTIVDEGLHRYLKETGRAFPHRLVAMCPMSLRDEGDTEAATKASAMFVHLGEHDATPVTERIAAGRGSAWARQRRSCAAMSKDAAMMYAVAVLGVAEVRTATHASRVTPPLANLVISNVPGGREKMYLNGADAARHVSCHRHRRLGRPERHADLVPRPHGLRVSRQRSHDVRPAGTRTPRRGRLPGIEGCGCEATAPHREACTALPPPRRAKSSRKSRQ